MSEDDVLPERERAEGNRNNGVLRADVKQTDVRLWRNGTSVREAGP